MIFFLLALLFFNIPSLHAESAEEYLITGNAQAKLGNFDAAIINYTRALDIDPNLSKAYNNRGVAYARENSLPRAIADFTMAIANNLKDPEAYNNRGLAYAKQGNLSQAILDYTKAIELNTFYTKAYNNREVAYLQLKEYNKAWSDVHTVKAIGGNVDPYLLDDLKKASGQDK